MWSEEVSNQLPAGQSMQNNDSGDSLASARRDLLVQLLQLQQQEEVLRQQQSGANLNNQNGQSRRNTLPASQMNLQPQENRRATMPMSNPSEFDDSNRNVANQAYLQGLNDAASVHNSSAADDRLARSLLSRLSHRQDFVDVSNNESSSNSMMHIQGGPNNDNMGLNLTAPIQQMEAAGQSAPYPSQMFNTVSTMAIADHSRNIPKQQSVAPCYPDSTMMAHSGEVLERVDFGKIPDDALFLSQLPGMKKNTDDAIAITEKLTKKKRKKAPKKKPFDMPRRPLSAYNLFFSEERERILREISPENSNNDKDSTDGSNHQDPAENPEAEQSKQNAGVGNEQNSSEPKCKALMIPLDRVSKKRRPHRKTHGKIGFKNLARMVGQRWRSLPKDKLQYYQKLAQQDMKRHKKAMQEYYQKKGDPRVD